MAVNATAEISPTTPSTTGSSARRRQPDYGAPNRPAATASGALSLMGVILVVLVVWLEGPIWLGTACAAIAIGGLIFAIYFVIDARPTRRRPKSLPAARLPFCPFCGRPCRTTGAFCHVCGQRS